MPDAYPLLASEQRDQLRSLEQNAENPLLTRKSLGDIQGEFEISRFPFPQCILKRRDICNGSLIWGKHADLYAAPPSDPRMSFLLNKDHARLPERMYLQICGRDPLRDEAFLWEKLVREGSRSRSKIHVYQGMPHGFWRFLQMEASRGWIEDLIEGVLFLLGSGEDREKGELDVEVKAL
jgi:acetyl esterase/lipase